MLIGDKGLSGGRRWEVGGFALGAFSTGPRVRRLEVGLPDSGFSTSPKVSRSWCCILASGHFATGHPIESHRELTMINQLILSIDHPY